MSYLGVVIVVFGLVLSGCGSDDASSDQKPSGPPRSRVEVLNSSISESDLPPGCSLREVQTIFNEMLTGANTRNRSQVLRRIAPQPELVSFSLGRGSRSPTGDSGQTFRTPAAIYRYFADQSLRGHQRFLRSASVEPITPGNKPRSGPVRRPASGPAADDPVVGVGFGITVTDKNDQEIVLTGKGAINCETGRFYAYGGG